MHLEELHKICRRVTQNMLASHNSPTIAINLRGLPLSAVTDQWSLSRSLHYYQSTCLLSIIISGKTPTTATSSSSSKICCHVIVTQQRPIGEQFTLEIRNLHLQAKKRIKWTASSSLHVTRSVNLSLVQCECHIGKQTVIAKLTQLIRIKLLISRFLEIFASWSQFPGGGKCPFCPPADAHAHRYSNANGNCEENQ